ncbi:MAG: flotillin domain-containing protein [Paracoccaceae bacterium]|nr:flotillin domain-containing protein [Paracoccaceae bacterium]MDG1737018.1 flotillin domain-containing protein [Paracoccaceae bacterium]MDG2257826.1 flotillin domain-containing protein [Paracoccaceae bacterium]
MGLIGWIILVVIVLAIIIALAAWWYERGNNEVSLLRTGVGGRRVVIDGGVLAIPYFHEISRVNMQTLRLDVDRRGDSSLITQDRLRVDVGAEFYVSVVPDDQSITRAAQTLGKRTFQRDELRNLIDGMMVDALRSVAARMTMDELHENRAQFVTEVRDGLKDTLSRYGLQLDSVSLTALDQTPFSALDENNAFNAVGMRKLAEVIAKSKKERAEIDADSEVSVRRASMEASRQRLEIDLEERRAEIAQQQEIETLAAAQIAEVAKRKADSERTATQAKIQMERAIQSAEVEREQALTIAEQERQIAISAKSQEENRAQAEADAARTEAVLASEAVETARATAEAKRRAALAEISAKSDANTTAARAAIAAESEMATAKDKAAARREEADAEKTIKLAQAEANRALIEAENSRSEAQVAMELEKARLDAMPKIVAEMVKPAEKINSINVNHVTGLGGGSGGDAAPQSPVTTAMDSIMEMAVQYPLLQKIGDQMGVSFDESLGKKKKD